jgi:peroxiredoxin
MTCLGHAAQLARMDEELKQRNAVALMLGGGTALAAKLAVRWLKPPFAVLRDPERAVYRAYGLDKALGILQESGTIVIDEQGRIRFAQSSANPRAAFPAERVLAALDVS